jgi:crotonobetainyl-CoA:carnitine CoA-transferase CaiB-like acyl-CoA transferase
LQREKTGRGQQVAVSLYNSMLAMQMQEAAMWLQRRRDLNWGAFPLTGVFATTDGALVLVGAFKTNPLQDICRALELPDLSADPRFASFDMQVRHKQELHARFRQRFASNTTAHWLERLDAEDLLCAPVRTLPEALGCAQTEVNGMIVSCDGIAGEPLKLIGTPLSMDRSAFRMRRRPPSLGADGADILAELGYAPERIAALQAEKVLA